MGDDFVDASGTPHAATDGYNACASSSCIGLHCTSAAYSHLYQSYADVMTTINGVSYHSFAQVEDGLWCGCFNSSGAQEPNLDSLVIDATSPNNPGIDDASCVTAGHYCAASSDFLTVNNANICVCCAKPTNMEEAFEYFLTGRSPTCSTEMAPVRESSSSSSSSDADSSGATNYTNYIAMMCPSIYSSVPANVLAQTPSNFCCYIMDTSTGNEIAHACGPDILAAPSGQAQCTYTYSGTTLTCCGTTTAGGTPRPLGTTCSSSGTGDLAVAPLQAFSAGATALVALVAMATTAAV